MSGTMKRSVVASVAASALVLASTLVWLDASREREYRRLLAVGDTAAQQGQTFEAVEAYTGALTLKPDSFSARLKRGDLYRRRGEYSSAVRDLSEAVGAAPSSPVALERLGDAHAALGQPEVAATDYQASLRFDDQAPRVAYKLGLVNFQAGRFPEAIDALGRAAALDPRLAEAHYLIALCLREQHQDADAERALLRAIEVNPAFLAARDELAAFYTDSGRLAEAVDQLEALSALEPGRPERFARLGLAYARLGQPDTAVLTLGRAADRHPQAAVIYVALGRVWLDEAVNTGDPVSLRKALEALTPMAERADASSEALTWYGRALYQSGRIADAEDALQRAARQFPVTPLAFRYLADAARALGHTDTARQAADRVAVLLRDD
jgi:tetratricopeptide (TPR) repeat protein